MCGIVGFLAKKPQHKKTLGRHVVPMLVCMGDRGPDSAGLAVFSETKNGAARRFSLYSFDRSFSWRSFEEAFSKEAECTVDAVENHAILTTSKDSESVKIWLRENASELHLLSVGKSMDVYKDTGHPRDISERYGFTKLQGTHCVGHTRMATESAVTPAHSHPFTAGEDFCLVHNGSFSNPYDLRRMLEKRGIEFETDNDTEAACRYLQWRLAEGDTIEAALQAGFSELDGFYTLLMATADKLVLVRDAVACKPAIVAESEDYVAIGSEYRTLAHLPDIQHAELFEPKPEEIYAWKV